MHGVMRLSVGDIKAGLLIRPSASSQHVQIQHSLVLHELLREQSFGPHAWSLVYNTAIADGRLRYNHLCSERRIVKRLNGRGLWRVGRGGHGFKLKATITNALNFN